MKDLRKKENIFIKTRQLGLKINVSQITITLEFLKFKTLLFMRTPASPAISRINLLQFYQCEFQF